MSTQNPTQTKSSIMANLSSERTKSNKPFRSALGSLAETTGEASEAIYQIASATKKIGQLCNIELDAMLYERRLELAEQMLEDGISA